MITINWDKINKILRGYYKAASDKDYRKDLGYRIMSQSPNQSRSIGAINDAILEQENGEPVTQSYTGSFRWTENEDDMLQSNNPDRDLNHLVMYGNVKQQYKPVPAAEVRGHNYQPFVAKNYDNKRIAHYYGNFSPAKEFYLHESNVPLLKAVIDHDGGYYTVAGEDRPTRPQYGVWEPQATDQEYEEAAKNGFTVDDTASYRVGFGMDRHGTPEVQFRDLIDYGGGYGKWGPSAAIQGALLTNTTNGSIPLLHQNVPIRIVNSDFLNNNRVQDISIPLWEAARSRNILGYNPNTGNYYGGWLPEIMIESKTK